MSRQHPHRGSDHMGGHLENVFKKELDYLAGIDRPAAREKRVDGRSNPSAKRAIEWMNAGITANLIDSSDLSYVEKQAALGVLNAETNEKIAGRCGNTNSGTAGQIISRAFKKVKK